MRFGLDSWSNASIIVQSAHLRHSAEGHGLLQHRHGARVVAQVRRVVQDAGDAANAAAANAAAKRSRTQRRDGRQVLGLLRLPQELLWSRRNLDEGYRMIG